MAKLLKLRRGTTSQHSSFTGAEGEVTIDTDKDTAVVHDGSTAAGRPLAREDLNNVASASITGRLSSGSIARAKIADDAINDAKIANNAVTADQLADNAVDTNSIQNDAVNNAKIATDAVNADSIAADSVGTSELANNAVDTNAIQNNAVTAGKIAAGQINSSHIADGTVIAADLAANSVGSSELADNAVGTNEIAADAVSFDKMQNIPTARFLGRTTSGTGDVETLAAGDARTLLNVENGATADQTSTEIKSLLASDNIGAAHIANNSIGNGELAADCVSGAKIQDNAIGAEHIAANSVGSSELADNAVDSNAIQTDAVTQSKIQDNSINEQRLEISNSGSNGQVLVRRSGNTGGMTWETVSADGGNAATVDGIDSSQFLRSDTADTASGDISFGGGAGAVQINGNSDIRLTSGDWTGNMSGASGKIQQHGSSLYLCGGDNGIIFREHGSDRWKIDGDGHFVPGANNTYDMGSNSQRIRNIYTGDLSLSNEGSNNDVDGTWGSYTIQEGEDNLFLINKRNGKKYKFNLTEVS